MAPIPDLAGLRGLAERQHGHFATRQAADHHVDSDLRGRLRAAGQICRVHQGVYRFAGVPLTRRGQVHAAVLAAGKNAVASHETALELHDLRKGWLGKPIEVCSPTEWRPQVPGITLHRSRGLEDCDRETIDRLPVTTGARTLVDLAGRFARIPLTQLVDEAICKDAVQRATLYRRAAALRNGRAGVGLIVVLAHPEAEAVFRSWLERQGAAAFRRFGVPSPRWNVRLHDERGFLGIVDCYWPEHDAVVELEGLRFHTTPRQRRRDAAWFNRLVKRQQGRVRRFTWQDIVERPGKACAEILDLLGVLAS